MVEARPARPSSTEQLRRHNTAAVLWSLRSSGPTTRADLAKRTGLAKATISTIVGELGAVGALAQLDIVSTPGPGRPGVQVGLRGDNFAALGLELNVDYVAAVALDLASEVIWQEVRPAGQDPLTALVALAADHRAHIGSRRLVEATVAVPGLVRGDNRTVSWAPNLSIDGTTVAARISEVTGVAARVSNDANCAALAEANHGAAIDVAHSLYLTGTVGIGAGIVDQGHLLRGGAGFAGEVGHLQIGDPDSVCGCGRTGCWEASIGLHALTKRLGVHERDTPAQTANAIADRLGDPAVSAVVEQVARDVGRGLGFLASVLDPQVIVLGGYFVGLAGSMLPTIAAEIDARLASSAQVRPDLRLSVLGPRAAATGAAEMSFSGVFSGSVDLADLG